MGTGLLTTGKGCPGSTEFRPEGERTPDAEHNAEKKTNQIDKFYERE